MMSNYFRTKFKICNTFALMNKRSLIIASILIVVAMFSRMLPHPDNFSPMGAVALFGGAVITSTFLKYLVPIVTLYVSDLVLNNTLHRVWFTNHEGFVWFSDYMIFGFIAFILAVAIGHFFIKKNTIKHVFGGAIAFTLVFFLITNFGTWASGTLYPQNFAGLMSCYVAGLQYLEYSFAGNLFYCTVLFGGYYLMTSRTYITEKA